MTRWNASLPSELSSSARGDLTKSNVCGQYIKNMGVTIHLDLPDALVKEAQANGLLESAPLGDLLVTELRRRRPAAELNQVLEGLRAQPGASLPNAVV